MSAADLIHILERGSLESRLLAVALHRSKRISVLDVFIPTPENQGYFYIFDFHQNRNIYICAKRIVDNASFLSTM
jgi:hypothetical protein